jgi:hypothetical protein
MAEGQRMTAADGGGDLRAGRRRVGRGRARCAGHASQRVSSAAVGDAGGEIELLIPRARHGSYFPSFLEPRRRSEPAIVAVVMEAYLWLDAKHVKGRDHGRVVSKRWSSPMQCTRADCGSYVLSPLAAPHHRRGGLVRFRPCTGLGLSALLPAAVEATPG